MILNLLIPKLFYQYIFLQRCDISEDIDFIGKVGNKAFGLQIKSVTVNANLGNYDVSARMQSRFRNFQDKFSGQVFIIYSVDEKIMNKDVYDKIKTEIDRLKAL